MIYKERTNRSGDYKNESPPAERQSYTQLVPNLSALDNLSSKSIKKLSENRHGLLPCQLAHLFGLYKPVQALPSNLSNSEGRVDG